MDNLAKEPDLAWSALRLLGHAFSNATAPAGSLPEGVERISEDLVEFLGSELGCRGSYKAFGESDLGTVLEIWLHSGAELTALRRQEASLDDYIAELEALGGLEMAGLDSLQSQRYAKLKARASACGSAH